MLGLHSMRPTGLCYHPLRSIANPRQRRPSIAPTTWRAAPAAALRWPDGGAGGVPPTTKYLEPQNQTLAGSELEPASNQASYRGVGAGSGLRQHHLILQVRFVRMCDFI
jgi:hypothetical protein